MEFIFVIIILIMSVVIHEVSHGYAALYLGDRTAEYQGRLTLNPLAHLDPIGSFIVPILGYVFGGIIVGWAKPVPYNPYNLRNPKWGEALVAMAGPLSNICIALVFGLLLRFSSGLGLTPDFISLANFVIIINLTLAIFNLLPIPPLDGSKILFSILPYKWSGFRASFERYGVLLVFIFVVLIWKVIEPLIFKLFLLFSGSAM